MEYNRSLIVKNTEVTVMRTAAIKDTLHQLADQLSDEATWDDVMEKVRFRQAVEKGIRAADRGEFATAEEVKAAFTRWGVNVAS
ncbi:MAG: putative transcriptional regulator [Kiritimatiellia bacterium]|jgi:predicted transcriptional regulator